MANDRTKERGRKREFRGRRETRLAVSVLSVRRRRGGTVVTHLRGECVARARDVVEHGKFTGDAVQRCTWPSSRRIRDGGDGAVAAAAATCRRYRRRCSRARYDDYPRRCGGEGLRERA